MSRTQVNANDRGSNRFRCLRTESKKQRVYDLAVERAILEPAGADIVAVDIDDTQLLRQELARCDALLHFRGPLTGDLIRLMTRCRIIAHYGAGVDRIDMDTATQMGIMVTNGPRYAIEEVSTHAMTLLLACARKLRQADAAVREGRWHIDPLVPLYRLAGKTLGLLGFGNIARAVAGKAAAFGLEVIAHDPYVDFEASGAEPVDLETLFRRADFLSVHLPLTPETRGMVSGDLLDLLRPTAYLINTSRGAVVDQAALTHRLQAGRLAGAGLDVFALEPLPAGDPLAQLDQVILTGHVGFYSEDAIQQMQTDAANQVLMVMAGQAPEFCVNPEVL